MAAGLALTLCVTAFLAPAAPIDAGFLGKHTIFGQVFRMLPIGRPVTLVEDRQDTYRSANNWLSEVRSQNTVRQADLRRAYLAGKLDVRSYIHAKATLIRHEQQYAEVSERMKRIGRDNFHRGFGQLALEHIMPRLARSSGFVRRVDEVKSALETGRQLLEEGARDIDRLASKAYPEFMRQGHQRVKDLLTKLERSGLSGGPIDDLRRTLQGLNRGLDQLQKDVPEMVKPDEVKKLQQEARTAAQNLAQASTKLDQDVQRLRDRNTVYFPLRSVRGDARVKASLDAFAQDASLVSRALAESKIRRALGPRLQEALARIGVERGDALYTRILQRALNLLDPAKAAEMSDGELDALCSTARDQIIAEQEQPRVFGIATAELDLVTIEPAPDKRAPLYVSWDWRKLDSGNYQWEYANCVLCYPAPVIQSMPLSLSINLDTGEVTGWWSGSAEGQPPDMCAGESTATWSGAIEQGQVRVDQDGLGFSFEAQGWTEISMSATLTCENADQAKSGWLTRQKPTTIQGAWRAGEGWIKIHAADPDDLDLLLHVDLPCPYEIESPD